MSQIALPLDWPADESDDAFILSDANAEAVRQLDRWSLWPVKACILVGPRKSGRSLLGRLFTRKYRGRLIDDAELADEETLFHAWNAAQSDRLPLLVVANAPPPIWSPALPDLRSRLAATPIATLHEPDDALFVQLLDKQFRARGLLLPPELSLWLLPRVERSYLGLNRVVDALDQAALAQRWSRLSIRSARPVLIAAGLVQADVMDR